MQSSGVLTLAAFLSRYHSCRLSPNEYGTHPIVKFQKILRMDTKIDAVQIVSADRRPQKGQDEGSSIPSGSSSSERMASVSRYPHSRHRCSQEWMVRLLSDSSKKLCLQSTFPSLHFEHEPASMRSNGISQFLSEWCVWTAVTCGVSLGNRSLILPLSQQRETVELFT